MDATEMLQQLLEQGRRRAEQDEQLLQRMDRLEKALALSVIKEGYTTEEVAERVGNRTEWTVRQWCNKGRVRAHKVHGKGRSGEWRIPHDELTRIQAEGPLKECTFDNHGPRKAA